MARWMVTRGARHLILMSRFGPRNEEARALLRELREQGVHVEAPVCDISDLPTLRTFLSGGPQVKGCIQSSMLIEVIVQVSMLRNIELVLYRMPSLTQ